jgi:alkaline phosphatase
LESLYLSPIRQAKALGLIEGFDFHLMIDIKTEAYATLDTLMKQLRDYEALLYSPANLEGLKIIVSGNRPKTEDYGKYPSWIFFDYQSKTLDQSLPLEKIGMVSLSFRQFSVWNGKGRIVEAEKEKLITFVKQVHGIGKEVRFWATPDTKSAWRAFFDLGVDYINTDMPYEAKSYLENLQRNIFSSYSVHQPYHPTFERDGADTKIERIILMIGDGNGLAQISAGMFANGNQLNLAQFKSIGLVKTQAADDFTTDSAAGASAYATGKKTNNRALGLGPTGEILENLPEIIKRYGFRSGIITTDQLTGATPAAFYAHHKERDDINQIAGFLPQSSLDLFIGGGRRDFTQFGENRIAQLEAQGYKMMASLEEIGLTKADKVGYFASASGMPTMEKGRGDFLLKSTINALSFLESKELPFFLMIESAMIDSGGHANDATTVVTEVLDFDKAVGKMLEYVDQNSGTLLIVTADHETAGLALPQGNLEQLEVELAFHSDDHTGIMVPLFAYGAHSGEFRGVYENTEVFHKLMRLVERYFDQKK